MRTPFARPASGSILILSLVFTSGIALAGPLTPPAGPVAPTGKTLNEVEPRTAISAANTPGDANTHYIITKSGSYYLTENLSGGAGKQTVIAIKASDVSIDLNGFTVFGSGSEFVIEAHSLRDITITHGIIDSSNTAGIAMNSVSGVRLSGISAFNCSETGFGVGSGAVIEHCTIQSSGSQAFLAGPGAVIRDCTATGAGDAAFSLTDGVVENCVATGAGVGFEGAKNSSFTGCSAINCVRGFAATSNGRFEGCTVSTSSAEGIDSGVRGLVENCTVDGAGSDGIVAGDGSTVRGCNVSASAVHGISASNRCVIVSNNCSGNGAANPNIIGAGVYVSGSRTRVEDNTLTQNDWGVRVTGTGNIVIRNKASGSNGTNFNAVSGNSFGVIVAATVSPAISSNSSGGGLGTTDPNANLSY